MILGGGVGGLVAANELHRRLGREHQVVLVDRDKYHIFWPSRLWLQVGLREPHNITRELALLEKKGIRVIRSAGVRRPRGAPTSISRQDVLRLHQQGLSPRKIAP